MSNDFQELDRKIFDRELREFLPSKVFDAHVHFFDHSCLVPGTSFPSSHPYSKFGGTFGPSQYLEWAEGALPGVELYANHFGHPGMESDRDASAAYSGRISDNRQFFGLALVAPADTAERARRRVEQNQLVGFKPYPNFVADKPVGEVTVHDMLPAAQMEVANELGLAIMLHIPRPGRLADPVNQVQMVELCRRYPNARIIFAHIGRAYFLSNVVGFLDGIAACPNAYIDTAMINHEGVLEYALQNFPRDRILFGADAPFSLLRGKSVEINNQYAYLMGEDYDIGTVIFDTDHAVTFTTFFYEQLRGIRLAAERARLEQRDIEDLFFNNADRLFRGVTTNNYGEPGGNGSQIESTRKAPTGRDIPAQGNALGMRSKGNPALKGRDI
ncbi:MAG: amidohydrolase family protein [Kiritimatiellia bacterium]|nr:amidohydrolase family protein [Kiritimatiellia bacterium]